MHTGLGEMRNWVEHLRVRCAQVIRRACQQRLRAQYTVGKTATTVLMSRMAAYERHVSEFEEPKGSYPGEDRDIYFLLARSSWDKDLCSEADSQSSFSIGLKRRVLVYTRAQTARVQSTKPSAKAHSSPSRSEWKDTWPWVMMARNSTASSKDFSPLKHFAGKNEEMKNCKTARKFVHRHCCEE